MSHSSSKQYVFSIAVTGACNLRCPSCSVGNLPEIRPPKGFMSSGLLDRFLAKANSECEISLVTHFMLTEPLLHPNLAEIVATVNKHGLLCSISSNLNVSRNIDEIMAARPHYFSVSVSGFQQANYEQTHAGGNIE